VDVPTEQMHTPAPKLMIFVEAYKIIVLRGNTHAYNLTGIYKGYDLGTQKVTFI